MAGGKLPDDTPVRPVHQDGGTAGGGRLPEDSPSAGAPRGAAIASPAALPTSEPGRSLADQRDELRVLADELEGTLRFMGTGHPRRAETVARLEQARAVLAVVEAELARATTS